MVTQQRSKNKRTIYVMLLITLLLMASTTLYLSHFTTTEQELRADKDLVQLNGPWKFITGDNIQYAQSNYNDSAWKTMDLTAPSGAHDDDVGLSGFIPGWTEKGYPKYAGYAWYRIKFALDTLAAGKLALIAPPAVDDAYQLYINGVLTGSSADFSGKTPVAYSIRPRMITLSEEIRKQKFITIAFRVWMSAAGLAPGSGGIHIAPTLGTQIAAEKKYAFQWEQTIKGYIVEVVLPVMFVLLAITLFLFGKDENPSRSYSWFIIALILTGLLRFNQATYFWFEFESGQQATIIGSVIVRPLVLGSWLMAWRQWFALDKPKWLPQLIALVSLLFMAAQLLSLSWISHSSHTHFQSIANYLRLLLLATMLFTLYQAIRKQRAKDILVYVALLVATIAMYPQEISALNIIPGIWFPYGVGVSRGQFFYAVFVLLLYLVLIRKNKPIPA